MKEKTVKVAVIQATLRMFDTPGTIKKACELIEKAAGNGVKLMLFPEAFIGGYPKGMHLGVRVGIRTPEGRKDFRRYYENAICIPGPETDALAAAAAKAGAYVVSGVIEREENTSTLYCTALFIGPNGKVLGKHRKLVPTAAERLIWGSGDGSTLPVFTTPFGKIGAVICWENYMPLLRSAMYGKGLDIYLAPTFDARESWQISMRHIALESHCFVLTCNQFLPKSAFPTDLLCYDELAGQPDVLHRGGSAIINPFGEYLGGPLWDEEGIACAELDMGQIREAKFDFDVTGHYTRPDVMRLFVNEREQSSFNYENLSDCAFFEEECEEE